MATFFLSTRTGSAGTGAGEKHAAYISGLDRHADKTEVQTVIDKNIPASVAKDGLAFFQKADELERANGRSYRSLIIAIPREATDKTAWAQTFADDLLKDKHAYRLAIHDKGDGNPHAHLMFSERGLKEGKTAKDFFSRQNPKDRFISHKDWLSTAKLAYLQHVQGVCPTYTPKLTGEPKIGQKLKNASPAWEAQRAKRENQVHRIRNAEAELAKVDASLVAQKTAYVIDQHRPNFERLTPQNQTRGRAKIKLHISKPNKDGSPKTLKQILKEVEQAIANWLKAQTEELERMAREAQARAMEAERQRLAALGGIPSPFAFSPSSSWGRAAEQATAAITPEDRPRYKV
jgi:MobA/MobL family